MKKPKQSLKKNAVIGKPRLYQQLPVQVRKQLGKHYDNKYGVAKKG